MFELWKIEIMENPTVQVVQWHSSKEEIMCDNLFMSCSLLLFYVNRIWFQEVFCSMADEAAE